MEVSQSVVCSEIRIERLELGVGKGEGVGIGGPAGAGPGHGGHDVDDCDCEPDEEVGPGEDEREVEEDGGVDDARGPVVVLRVAPGPAARPRRRGLRLHVVQEVERRAARQPLPDHPCQVPRRHDIFDDGLFILSARMVVTVGEYYGRNEKENCKKATIYCKRCVAQRRLGGWIVHYFIPSFGVLIEVGERAVGEGAWRKSGVGDADAVAVVEGEGGGDEDGREVGEGEEAADDGVAADEAGEGGGAVEEASAGFAAAADRGAVEVAQLLGALVQGPGPVAPDDAHADEARRAEDDAEQIEQRQPPLPPVPHSAPRPPSHLLILIRMFPQRSNFLSAGSPSLFRDQTLNFPRQ